jgi:hypothetical protein
LVDTTVARHAKYVDNVASLSVKGFKRMDIINHKII